MLIEDSVLRVNGISCGEADKAVKIKLGYRMRVTSGSMVKFALWAGRNPGSMLDFFRRKNLGQTLVG